MSRPSSKTSLVEVRRSRGFKRLRDNRGQALAETGMVITFLMLLCLGIVEFGRAYMITNVTTHALRDAARLASVIPRNQRDSDGTITNQDAIKERVKTIMGDVVATSTLDTMTVLVEQPTENGVNLVTVSVDVNIPYMFNLVGTSFQMQRSVSFRDEGR